MWLPGSVIFLVPVALIAIRLLDSARTRYSRAKNNVNHEDREVYDQKHPNPSFPS